MGFSVAALNLIELLRTSSIFTFVLSVLFSILTFLVFDEVIVVMGKIRVLGL